MSIWPLCLLAPQRCHFVVLVAIDTGIVITASHNPPKYNGYKAYWDDGGQIIPPHDKGIIDEIPAAYKDID